MSEGCPPHGSHVPGRFISILRVRRDFLPKKVWIGILYLFVVDICDSHRPSFPTHKISCYIWVLQYCLKKILPWSDFATISMCPWNDWPIKSIGSRTHGIHGLRVIQGIHGMEFGGWESTKSTISMLPWNLKKRGGQWFLLSSWHAAVQTAFMLFEPIISSESVTHSNSKIMIHISAQIPCTSVCVSQPTMRSQTWSLCWLAFLTQTSSPQPSALQESLPRISTLPLRYQQWPWFMENWTTPTYFYHSLLPDLCDPRSCETSLSHKTMTNLFHVIMLNCS